MSEKQILLYKLETINKILINLHKSDNAKITKSNTLFILDWDDTLFPTSWITKNNIDLTSHVVRENYIDFFKDLDSTLFMFLNSIKKYGKIIIVTNAITEWVKMSSIIMVKTFNLLKNIEIVSARSLFSGKTQNVMEWKKRTFNVIIDNEYKDKKLMNVISIGDAEYEHQALVNLTQSNFDKIKYLKSFRLIKEPTYEQLVEELSILNEYIKNVWNINEQLCKSFNFVS